MSGTVSADRAAPLACAALNAAAALALLLVLSPATPLVADPAERERYVREHLLAWRAGWSLWIAAGFSLLWFYAWWRARVRGPHAALAIAAIGYLADVTAETTLIVAAPDALGETAPFAFLLTGGVANGLYTLAGIALTLATPLGTTTRVWAAAMWASGIVLSVGAFASAPLVIAAGTAVLFALFCPWCVYLAARLR